MNHAEIEERNVAARYAMDTLSEDDRIAFEEHFVDCPQCQDAIALQRALRAGVRGSMSTPAPRRRDWRPLAVAAGVVIAVALAALTIPFNQQHRPATPLAPQSAPPLVFSLSRTRGDETEPVNRLTLPAAPRRIALTVDVEDSAPATCRVTLTANGKALVAESVMPCASHTVTLIVPSQSLAPGDYVLAAGGQSYALRVVR